MITLNVEYRKMIDFTASGIIEVSYFAAKLLITA